MSCGLMGHPGRRLVSDGASMMGAIGDVQRAGLVGRVLEDDIALLVLVLAEGDEDDVSVVDPDLFPQLAADQAETLDAVEAHGLESAVTKHLEDLGVLLAILLEGQLALLVAAGRGVVSLV